MRDLTTSSGFSVVEMMVVMSALAVVLVIVGSTLESASTSFARGTTVGALRDSAHKAVERMAAELRTADRDAIVIAAHDNQSCVTFRVARDFQDGDIVWSKMITYRFEVTAAGDPLRGIADKGDLVRLQGQDRTVLCRDVDIGGFAVARNRNNLVVDLDVTARSTDGHRVTARSTASVTVRNSSSSGAAK